MSSDLPDLDPARHQGQLERLALRIGPGRDELDPVLIGELQAHGLVSRNLQITGAGNVWLAHWRRMADVDGEAYQAGFL